MKNWLFLGVAIAAEVVATSSLKASAGFTKFLPSLLVVLGYAIAFYFLALTLKAIPVGIAYAIWAGVGIVLIALAGWLVFGQKDRKSTRLNSSHVASSYAVFCLK